VLNIEQLLRTGAMEGPFRRPIPATRKTIFARRAYRALWVTVQTLALLMRANTRKD
jgi:hypothetical protein